MTHVPYKELVIPFSTTLVGLFLLRRILNAKSTVIKTHLKVEVDIALFIGTTTLQKLEIHNVAVLLFFSEPNIRVMLKMMQLNIYI